MTAIAERKTGGTTLSALLRMREVGIALLIVVVVIVTSINNSHFVGGNSIEQLLNGAALIALLGVGETLVLVTRNVDLSVGSVLGLSAYVVGDLFKYHHIPVWSGFVIGILVGLVCGAINGFVVTVLRVPSLVVTLGMLYAIRGLDGMIVNGDRIDPEFDPELVHRDRLPHGLQHPVAGDHRRGHRHRLRLRDALVPGEPRPVRHRVEPRRGRARRHPDRAPGVHRLPDQRHAGRARRRAVPRGAHPDRQQRRTRLRADASSRRPSSAAWRSSAAAARSSAPRSAPCCSTRSTRPWWPRASPRSGTRRSPARCCSPPSASTGGCRCE